MDSDTKNRSYQPELPPCLQGSMVRVKRALATTTSGHSVKCDFPLTYNQHLVQFFRGNALFVDDKTLVEHPAIRVGVVLSGKHSSGANNVLWGLFDALKAHNRDTKLFVLSDGFLEITDDVLSPSKNRGGNDIFGEKPNQIIISEEVTSAISTCKAMNLDGLVILGGVTSITDATYLAEMFVNAKCSTKVVGVPVSASGDLQNGFIETTIGFDTICQVSSNIIRDICVDAISDGQDYYFVRVLGGNASFVAMECAISTNPNMVIVGERGLSLHEITKHM